MDIRSGAGCSLQEGLLEDMEQPENAFTRQPFTECLLLPGIRPLGADMPVKRQTSRWDESQPWKVPSSHSRLAPPFTLDPYLGFTLTNFREYSLFARDTHFNPRKSLTTTPKS